MLESGLLSFGESILSWMQTDYHALHIVMILVTVWFVHRFGAKIVSKVLAKTIRADLYPTKTDRDKRVKTLESLARAIMGVGAYIIGAMLLLGEINPDYATAMFASAGLITVAIGFGAKNLINDFISGIFIISENQYRVGDYVEIAEVMGTVEAVTVRTTILRDLDGNVHHVPNGAIVVTTNKTIGFSNLNENIVLAQGTDLGLVEHLVNHAGQQMVVDPEFKSKVQEAPSFAGLNGYAQGGIVIKVSGKVAPGEKYAVKSGFYRLLYKAFDKHNIETISSPQPAGPAKKKAAKRAV